MSRSPSLLNQIEQFLSISHKPKPIHLIYSSHPSWPFHSPTSQKRQPSQVDVGVLDSSFNPPQRAHFSLAKSAKPDFRDEDIKGKEYYDALLLLFSIQNADKGTGTSKDASTVNRLEMMQEFAKDLEEDTQANIAVAIVEEPLMIAKSTLIHDYIQQQNREEGTSSPVRLHWLVGFDTLQRFFQVKYYPSPDFFEKSCDNYFVQERTTLVCARRSLESQPKKQTEGKDEEQEERELLESKAVKPWLDRGVVVMINLDADVKSVSSTAIRKTIDEEKDNEELRTQLQQLTTKRVARYLVEKPVYRKEE